MLPQTPPVPAVHPALAAAGRCFAPVTASERTMPRSRSSASRLSSHMMDLGVHAPLVIANRLSRMALAGPQPSARDRREFERMVSEKWFASQESAVAMGASLLRMQQDLVLAAMRACTTAPFARGGWMEAWSWQERLMSMAADGLAPLRSKAVANARRLRGPAGRR